MCPEHGSVRIRHQTPAQWVCEMDCRQANLMIGRPGRFPEDAHAQAWAALAEHLETCAACDAAFRESDELDAEITAAMTSVAVPEDGADRLLRMLEGLPPADQLPPATGLAPDQEAALLAPAPADPRDPRRPRSRSRRRWWALAATITLSVMAAVAMWLTQPAPPTLTLQTLRELAPVAARDVAALPEFQADETGFEAPLPRVGWSHLRVSLNPHRWMAPEREPVAIYSFAAPPSASARRPRPPVRGALLVIPASALTDPPQATTFSTSDVVYTTREGVHYATVSWTEGELVYVCMVENQAGSLDTLQQLLTGSMV